MQEEDGQMNSTEASESSTGPMPMAPWTDGVETMEVEPVQPNQPIVEPKIPSVLPALTREEADRLEKSSGMSRVRLRRMAGFKKVAELMEEMGAVKVCTGDYMFSQSLRLEAIQKCRKAFSKCVTPEDTAILAKALCQLIDSKDETTTKILETVQNGVIPGAESGPMPKLPPRGVAIIAQNVTVNPQQSG